MALGTSGVPYHYAGRAKHITKEPYPISATAADYGHATGSNAAVTFAPVDASNGVALIRIDFAYQTAPTGRVTIGASDGTLVWGPFTILAANAPGLNTVVFDPPLLFTKGATLTITLLDGSVTKDLWAEAYIEGTNLY
jgi:hypothetical protein